MRWYFTAISICILLMSSDTEHVSILVGLLINVYSGLHAQVYVIMCVHVCVGTYMEVRRQSQAAVLVFYFETGSLCFSLLHTPHYLPCAYPGFSYFHFPSLHQSTKTSDTYFTRKDSNSGPQYTASTLLPEPFPQTCLPISKIMLCIILRLYPLSDRDYKK